MTITNLELLRVVEVQSRRLRDPVAKSRVLRLALRSVTTPVDADRSTALRAAIALLRDALPADDRPA